MSLHGEIRINNHVIGEWVAQNAGPRAGDGIYRCHVWYTDMRGHTSERRFFLMHNYDDGALVLGAKVMLEFNRRRGTMVYSEVTEWYDFCDANNLHPVDHLGSHISLKE